MRRILCRVRSLVVVSLALGCGGPPGGEGTAQERCLRLRAQEDAQVSLPARISLLFTVDTCRGQPVSGLTLDDFTLLENGTTVSRYESRMTLMPRAQAHTTYTAVLLDVSGSILHSGAWPQLRVAVESFITEVLEDAGEGHQVALLTFDGQVAPVEWVPYTANPQALVAALDALEVRECTTHQDCAPTPARATCAAWRCVDDSTNLYGAVARGASHVAAAVQADARSFRQGALVIFTDGTDQAARVSRQEAASALKTSGVHAFTVGLGGEVDPEVLKELGRDGAFSAERPESLGAAFTEVAQRLTALAGRFYALDYCSPKRSGRHALTLRASFTDEDGTSLQGALETGFDATGFGPGCDVPGAATP